MSHQCWCEVEAVPYEHGQGVIKRRLCWADKVIYYWFDELRLRLRRLFA